METTQETLLKNAKQKEFYNTKKKGIPTKIWSYLREKTLKNIRKELGILDQAYDLHQHWMGDLSSKKVLDLGCYSGNRLSVYMAKNSKKYVGLDLSDKGIDILKKKLKDIPNAEAVAQDFFSDEFTEKDFDIIYAYGVLHHFKNTDNLISRLNEKLAEKGHLISYDPLETSYPILLARKLYRPFQTDAAWEWPFNRSTVQKFETSFNILEKRGILGKAKWYFIISLLPIGKEKKLRWGKKAHKKDWEESSLSNKYLYSCMQLTMLAEKK